MKLKVGDILRVTHFTDRLSKSRDVGWMIVTSVDPLMSGGRHLGDGRFIPDVGKMSISAAEDFWDPEDTGAWMIETIDEFEVIPKDKVPDEVWAALAMWRLLS